MGLCSPRRIRAILSPDKCGHCHLASNKYQTRENVANC